MNDGVQHVCLFSESMLLCKECGDLQSIINKAIEMPFPAFVTDYHSGDPLFVVIRGTVYELHQSKPYASVSEES